MEHLSQFDIGYIVGLAVGEGSFTGDKYGRFCMKLHFEDPKPLEFLVKKLGGRLYGPYNHGSRHYRHYQIQNKEFRTRPELIEFFDKYLPPSKKREQFLRWREKYSF